MGWADLAIEYTDPFGARLIIREHGISPDLLVIYAPKAVEVPRDVLPKLLLSHGGAEPACPARDRCPILDKGGPPCDGPRYRECTLYRRFGP